MMKPVYIKSASAISSQNTFDDSVLSSEFVKNTGNRWSCIEPDYSSLIDAKKIRRMSRIIRMSVASAMQAVTKAAIPSPDAIVVGSALGCLDDTDSFLSKMVQFNEDMLSPTSFIHSTHNTIASQVALHFKCYGYNSTYVHRSLSFESALIDALMLINEGTSSNVLVGGADEIIDSSFTIMQRMGLIKENESSHNGFNIGEGASFFILSDTHGSQSIAKISGAEVWSFMSEKNTIDEIMQLIKNSFGTIPDLILAGNNGDESEDKITDNIISQLGLSSPVFKYKSLCGEYGTASAFALWLATTIIKTNTLPNHIKFETNSGTPVKSILIYNQLGGIHHSVILVEAC